MRKLDDEFMRDLKDKSNSLNGILDFEKAHRGAFMVEIRNKFLDLYYLGHSIEVRRGRNGYKLAAKNTFNPKVLLRKEIQEKIISDDNKWHVDIDNIEKKWVEEILKATIAKIVQRKEGKISEGISEVNHFIDNRSIRNSKNGILAIDRQVDCGSEVKGKMDLIGVKIMAKNGKCGFAVIELKNKNNPEIANVFTNQLKRYVDVVYNKYEYYTGMYKTIIEQKVALGLLEAVKCVFAAKKDVTKKDIEGIAILDNYNIRSDLKYQTRGLLYRAIEDWKKIGNEYTMKMFLKTNILDNTFFYDRNEAEKLLCEYKSCNS